MRSTIRRAALSLIASILLVGIANAETLTIPPADLFPDTARIALTTRDTPDSRTATATYANEPDVARVAVRVVAAAEPILTWGRQTTAESVNNDALGLVPAWRVPADFVLADFLAATGCADARLVATDTPRADLMTDELGYFAEFALPVETPVNGALALCLTADGVIVQAASVWRTDAEPLALMPELVAATVTWLDAPEPDAPVATCEAGDGKFRVQVIVEGDC